MIGLKVGGILWTARVAPLSCKQAQKSRDRAKKSEQKNSDGVEGGGGIKWTARVPSLSCKQAQNSGDSAKKSEQKNGDGVEGGGIKWTAQVPSLSCKQAQKSRDRAKKSEQKNSDGVEGGGGLNGQPGFPHFHVNRPKIVGTSQRKAVSYTHLTLPTKRIV